MSNYTPSTAIRIKDAANYTPSTAIRYEPEETSNLVPYVPTTAITFPLSTGGTPPPPSRTTGQLWPVSG